MGAALRAGSPAPPSQSRFHFGPHLGAQKSTQGWRRQRRRRQPRAARLPDPDGAAGGAPLAGSARPTRSTGGAPRLALTVLVGGSGRPRRSAVKPGIPPAQHSPPQRGPGARAVIRTWERCVRNEDKVSHRT